MDMDKLFESASLDGIADNVFGVVNNSVSEVKEMQRKKVAENVQLVVDALKKIESNISSRYDLIGNTLEKRILTIKDGRDGIHGRDGRNGKDGKNGRDGLPGPRGADGKPGRDGADGSDGVSVTDAKIDFDGSLIISLSSGREINVGEVVAPALAEQIKVITNGGGTSQSVIDTLASLQAQITALSGAVIYKGLWNASTNTPTLTSSVGTSGNFYIVSVAGSTSLDGITNWGVGDWAIFNGTAWQRVEGGAAGNFTTVTASSLTSGRVTYAGTGGLLQDSANLTFNGTTLTAAGFSGPISGVVTSTSITDSGLTSGRLTYASTGGLLADSASLTWDGSYLTAASIKDTALTSGRVTYAGASGLLQDSANLTFNGTTLTANTIGAFTLGGTVAGGGNNINNVIIGASSPLAGAFTTLSADNNTVLASAGNTKTVQIGSLSAPANVGTLQQTFNGASVWGGQTTVGGETDFGWNFYYYGGFKSRLADVASRLSFNATSGRVSFWTAPSPGSADAALTFTEALRIDATTGVTALGAMAVGNGLAVTGTLSATGAIKSTGANLANEADCVKLSFEGTSASAINAYGTDASTAGSFSIYSKSSNGSVSGAIISGKAAQTLALEGASRTTGTGIAFPATQSASTDANTLDDYEEGTWTPSIGGTATYTLQSGTYTKVGRLVSVSAVLQINVIGTGSVNTITGLPFTRDAVNNQAPGSMTFISAISSTVSYLVPVVQVNTSTVIFQGLLVVGNTTSQINVFQNSARVDFQITYQTT